MGGVGTCDDMIRGSWAKKKKETNVNKGIFGSLWLVRAILFEMN